ncbi:MAG: NACHT domain-containing protein, partial [Candidatus Electrothrix sp. AX5]|nr:NACHT domain-containing protein [Candidatus Electrothrix sp. AX5]
MAGIEEFALGVVASLVASALSSSPGFTALSYLKRKKIENRVENATAEVVEPLLPFLANEGLSNFQQELLFRTCTKELDHFTIDSSSLFSGSLDGQKIFDKLYTDKELPRTITDEDLESIYTLLCPRVATLLCRLPAAVKDWEANAWTENFSRLDEVAAELRQLFVRLDADGQRVAEVTSGVLATARRSLAQRVSMKLDLTGLRSDKPLSGKFSDFFVHPELERIQDNQQETKDTIGSEQEAAQRFIQRGTRAVILGAPGSGKSTWTRWLQKELLDNSSWPGLALRMELRSLSAASLPSVHELIRQQLTIHIKEELTPERIREWIEAGQLVLLLDGFDEIAPACRKTVREWIADMAGILQSCPVLITSRPLTTNHLTKLSKKWFSWEIKPFDKKRIIDYIQRWYAHTELLADSSEKPEPEQLAAQLDKDPTIGPLTSNPLLLSTLLMVHHLDGSLPSGRAELYKRYVDGMLGIWDDRRKVAGTDIALFS